LNQENKQSFPRQKITTDFLLGILLNPVINVRDFTSRLEKFAKKAA
jgi:hypothetical protein